MTRNVVKRKYLKQKRNPMINVIKVIQKTVKQKGNERGMNFMNNVGH